MPIEPVPPQEEQEVGMPGAAKARIPIPSVLTVNRDRVAVMLASAPTDIDKLRRDLEAAYPGHTVEIDVFGT